MSLRKSVRNVSKQGNLIPATVISSAGNRATVRLLSNGAVYRTLKVVGGPVTNGQVVAIDMNSDIPIIVAPGLPAQDLPSFDIPRPKSASKKPPTLPKIVVTPNQPPVPPGSDPPIADPDQDPEDPDVINYPPDDDGLIDALDDVEDNGTVYIPEGTFSAITVGGCSDNTQCSKYYRKNVHIVGAGIGKTILTGRITTIVPCFISDLSIIIDGDDSENLVGFWWESDVTVERVDVECSNAGSGLALGAYSEFENHINLKNVSLLGDNYGMYLFGGGVNLAYPYTFYDFLGWASYPDDIHVNYADLTWDEVTASAGWHCYSGALGIVAAKPVDMTGLEVHIVYDITSGSSVVWGTNAVHKLETLDTYIGTYGGSPPAEYVGENHCDVQDQGYVMYVNGNSGSGVSYGPGDEIEWVWTHSPDFEACNDMHNRIWFSITRLVDENHSGVPQTWEFKRAYILYPDGTKENIKPFRCYCYAQDSQIDCVSGSDIYLENYTTLEYNNLIYGSKTGGGTIVFKPLNQPATYFGDEPTATYPGQNWVQEV